MATTEAAPRAGVASRSDEFSAADFAQAHAKKALVGALVLGALAASYFVYTGTRNRQQARAEQAYFTAQQSLGGGDTAAARKALEQVTQRYENTGAGTQAMILLAQQKFDAKQIPAGIKMLEDVVGNGAAKPYRTAIYGLIGAGYEDQGKFAEAANAYQQAADAATLDLDRLTMRANKARALTSANKLDEAKAIWTDLSKDPSAPLAGEARVRLGELEFKAAAK